MKVPGLYRLECLEIIEKLHPLRRSQEKRSGILLSTLWVLKPNEAVEIVFSYVHHAVN